MKAGWWRETYKWSPGSPADLLRDFLQVKAPIPRKARALVEKGLPVLPTPLPPSQLVPQEAGLGPGGGGLWPKLLDSDGAEIAVPGWRV